MYRINSVLSKPGIVRPRYQSSQTRNFFSNCGNKSKSNSNNYGRHMSTAPNNAKNVPVYAGAAVGGVILTSVIYAKYNDGFRHSVEESIPYTKQVFSYVIPKETVYVAPEEEVVNLPPPSIPTSEIEVHDDGGAGKGGKDEHLVVNIMDTPTPSSIDLEFGREEEPEPSVVATDTPNELVHENEDEGELVAEGVPPTCDEVHDHEREIEALEAVVGTAMEIIADNIPLGEAVLDIAEGIAELPAVADKIDDMEEAILETYHSHIEEHVTEFAGLVEDISEFIEVPLSLETTSELPVEETPVVDETPVVEEVVLTAEDLNTVLGIAYENLRIILDDTVTTKTSAAGMLHGYLTQFGQALLIPRNDPAYESVWEAAATLEHNVMESVALVKAKETEARLQMEKLLGLIGNIRAFGVNDTADKAESLIAVSGENLHWGETEMELATNKLNFLHDFQKRVEGSPQKLKEYLDDFTPDLIKLLRLEKLVEAQNMSSEDALLMLSLKRPELIYAEVQKREIELKKDFETTLEQQKDELLKQAEINLNNALEILASSKDDEMKVKVEELIEFHANHLDEELKAQAEANALAQEVEIAKHEAELTLKHEEEMTQKLSAQEEEHQYNISKNLSSLKAIRAKITEVAELTRQQHQNQNLWAAAQTLSNALCNASDNGRTRSLLPALSDVKQISKNDDVLAEIISSVPAGAADLGVVPEDALIQRFSAVKRACMRVAAVKNDSILSYTFSYIKSLFVISRYYQRHIDADVDIDNIGPYEILEKADYYMQQGDIVQAAKFMSLLNGIPRKLCADWLNEVRLLLETKQSVNLLLAYAGSFIEDVE